MTWRYHRLIHPHATLKHPSSYSVVPNPPLTNTEHQPSNLESMKIIWKLGVDRGDNTTLVGADPRPLPMPLPRACLGTQPVPEMSPLSACCRKSHLDSQSGIHWKDLETAKRKLKMQVRWCKMVGSQCHVTRWRVVPAIMEVLKDLFRVVSPWTFRTKGPKDVKRPKRARHRQSLSVHWQ
jgi:hypothetical protein